MPPQSETDGRFSRTKATRERLQKAAMLCFLRSGVSGASVDQIASVAGVSRGTFYVHFRNKDAILVALLQRNRAPQARQMRLLRDLDPCTLGSVRDWLMGCVIALRQRQDQLQLFSLATVYESDARREINDQRMESIQILGTRYRRFDTTRGDEAERSRTMTEALLMMFQIDQTFSALTHGDIMPDDGIALDILARRLFEFLTEERVP
ncbi:TetR/AcrR family transcriptional regulator [Sphingobium baderi]|nr:TetR/AcrR family transcriptional regulator [Sphingobium baderi]WRD77844.1 TetR/AcrR family transcriptional regulator [Sphingobium baderi]